MWWNMDMGGGCVSGFWIWILFLFFAFFVSGGGGGGDPLRKILHYYKGRAAKPAIASYLDYFLYECFSFANP